MCLSIKSEIRFTFLIQCGLIDQIGKDVRKDQ